MSSNQTSTDRYSLLEWDSRFFDRRIGRLWVSEPDHRLLCEVDDWCHSEDVQCVYALVEANARTVIGCLENHGYRFADIRMTLSHAGPSAPPLQLEQPDRPVKEADLPDLQRLAAESHLDSRFFSDPNFPREKSKALYSAWIARSCRQLDAQVWVAEREQRLAGYITCERTSGSIGQIGLFAVAPWAQGRGVGRQLVDTALRWFSDQGVPRVEVVTQGCNCRAQRIYQKCGFVTSHVQLWLHKWSNRDGSET